MTEHTPGPWRTEERDARVIPSKRLLRLIAVGPTGGPAPRAAVAVVYLDNFLAGVSGGMIDDESRANARLIAAAPDLIEVVRLVSRWLDGPIGMNAMEIHDRVDAAIAKATVPAPASAGR